MSSNITVNYLFSKIISLSSDLYKITSKLRLVLIGVYNVSSSRNNLKDFKKLYLGRISFCEFRYATWVLLIPSMELEIVGWYNFSLGLYISFQLF